MRQVKITEVMRFMMECLCHFGASRVNSEEAASVMVFSDRRGLSYFGLNRLHKYVNDIRTGRCDPNGEPTTVKESKSVVVVDGGNGLGAVVGNHCMKIAMDKAEETGVGWVVASGSNEFGPAAWYSMQALNRRMLGMAFCNTPPWTCPTRSCKAALGTNPISFAAPSKDDDSMALDMSTSATSECRLDAKRRNNEPLPEDCLVTEIGESENTPAVRCLLPLGGEEETGGYKGYGLALMVEILTSVSAGGKLPDLLEHPDEESVTPSDLSQCFVAVNTDHLADGFYDRMDHILNDMRNLPPVGCKKVVVPGDIEREKSEESCEFIKYEMDQMMIADCLAEELGIPKMTSNKI